MNNDAAVAIDVLAENGCHFLRSTINEVAKESSVGNRNAVIFIAGALEVLLKTRLAIEHWTLLFDDPSKAKLLDLRSGEFVSVAASKLVTRLNNVAVLDIKQDMPEKVFKLRNRVVHFAPPSDLAVRVEVALGLNFALEFIHNHLVPNMAEQWRADLTALKEEIGRVFLDLESLRTKRLILLADELKRHGVILTCPDCNQPTLILPKEEGEDYCLFCLAKTDGEELAQRYAADVLNWSWHDDAGGGSDPVETCFACERDALVTGVQVVNRPSIICACFSCAEVFASGDIQTCNRCSHWMPASEYNTTCTDCWAEIL